MEYIFSYDCSNALRENPNLERILLVYRLPLWSPYDEKTGSFKLKVRDPLYFNISLL